MFASNIFFLIKKVKGDFNDERDVRHNERNTDCG